MVVDHKRERVVRAHDGYGKEALDLFFRQPTDERRASIRIDAGVRKHPPNAGRFLDPFRIVSRMSDGGCLIVCVWDHLIERKRSW